MYFNDSLKYLRNEVLFYCRRNKKKKHFTNKNRQETKLLIIFIVFHEEISHTQNSLRIKTDIGSLVLCLIGKFQNMSFLLSVPFQSLKRERVTKTCLSEWLALNSKKS